jgi:hypothetical protein
MANRTIKGTRAEKAELILAKARKIHNNFYKYDKVLFINMNNKVEIICPKHGSFWQDLYGHTAKKNRCPQCTREADRLTTEIFIKRSKEIHGDKYDYSKVVYEKISTMVTIICPEHGEFLQRAGSHLAGCLCRKCFFDNLKLGKDNFILKAKEIHGDKYDYSKVVYVGNKKKVEIICPEHGSFWVKPNGHVSSVAGCRTCKDSKGEILVSSILNKYGIEFIREFKITPYKYRYDFYLPNVNIFIEFNGKQHYTVVPIFGGRAALKDVKKRDRIKKQIVKDNGGLMLTLTYLDLSEKIIETKIINYLLKHFPYWFRIDNKTVAYKSLLELYKDFKINLNVPILKLEESIMAKSYSIERLFYCS